MLTITDLHKSYPTPQGPLPVLRGVDLSLARGASLALMGESGSGKSTLLHLVAGLDRPDRGDIQAAGQALASLNERDLATWRREGIGLIFQQFNLIASLTVADNLAFQARLAAARSALASRAGRRLGLATLLDAIRNSSPAASSSAWPWGGRSPPGHPCCSPMNPPAISTKPVATRPSPCCWNWWPRPAAAC